MPICQKLNHGGLDQYAMNALKCNHLTPLGLKGLKCLAKTKRPKHAANMKCSENCINSCLFNDDVHHVDDDDKIAYFSVC